MEICPRRIYHPVGHVCNSQRQRFVNLASWTFLAIRLDCCGALQGKDVTGEQGLFADLSDLSPFKSYRSPVDIRSFEYFEIDISISKTLPNCSQCGFSWGFLDFLHKVPITDRQRCITSWRGRSSARCWQHVVVAGRFGSKTPILFGV